MLVVDETPGPRAAGNRRITRTPDGRRFLETLSPAGDGRLAWTSTGPAASDRLD